MVEPGLKVTSLMLVIWQSLITTVFVSRQSLICGATYNSTLRRCSTFYFMLLIIELQYAAITKMLFFIDRQRREHGESIWESPVRNRCMTLPLKAHSLFLSFRVTITSHDQNSFVNSIIWSLYQRQLSASIIALHWLNSK